MLTWGTPTLELSYRPGKFNPQTIDAVRRAGYGTAVTTAEYPLTHSLVDRYTWSRVRVGGSEPMPEFIANLGVSMPSITVVKLSIVGPALDRGQQPRACRTRESWG